MSFSTFSDEPHYRRRTRCQQGTPLPAAYSESTGNPTTGGVLGVNREPHYRRRTRSQQGTPIGGVLPREAYLEPSYRRRTPAGGLSRRRNSFWAAAYSPFHSFWARGDVMKGEYAAAQNEFLLLALPRTRKNSDQRKPPSSRR